VNSETLQDGHVLRYSIQTAGRSLSWADSINNWRYDIAYRDCFLEILRNAPFPAFFWETPPVTRATVTRRFEFVLVDSPALDGVTADARSFDEHFRAAAPGSDVVTFANLGGDAFLVAPQPPKNMAGYPHLADFARRAPEDQQHAFWLVVSTAMHKHLGTTPVWLSTSGLGVYWLHARLDSRPKYYTFEPYRSFRAVD